MYVVRGRRVANVRREHRHTRFQRGFGPFVAKATVGDLPRRVPNPKAGGKEHGLIDIQRRDGCQGIGDVRLFFLDDVREELPSRRVGTIPNERTVVVDRLQFSRDEHPEQGKIVLEVGHVMNPLNPTNLAEDMPPLTIRQTRGEHLVTNLLT